VDGTSIMADDKEIPMLEVCRDKSESGEMTDDNPAADQTNELLRNILAKNASKRLLHSTNDFESFVNLMKGTIGSGIVALPIAIQRAGYVLGPLATLFLGIIATHCMVSLVEITAQLCKSHNIPALDYAETAMLAVNLRYPKPQVPKVVKFIVNAFLTIVQFGFCTVYLIFISECIYEVMSKTYCVYIDQRVWIVVATVPLIVFAWIHNLDHLAPITALANICLISGILIVISDEIYLFISGQAAVSNVGTSHLSWSGNALGFAMFFGNTIFAYEAIGVVLPVENKMKNPGHAKYIIYISMSIVVSIYILFGLLGYLAFGNDLHDSVTFNLCPENAFMAIIFALVNIFFGYSVFASYLVQFYVPLDFLQPLLIGRLKFSTPKYKDTVIHKSIITISNILLRTILVVITTTLAVCIPDFGDVLTLVGSVCANSLTLIFPPILYILTFWDVPDHTCLPRPLWLFIEIAIIVIGLLGFIAGSLASLYNIVIFFIEPHGNRECHTGFKSICHLPPP
jgi:proton-coupled amino acid transporter